MWNRGDETYLPARHTPSSEIETDSLNKALLLGVGNASAKSGI
jgi:hypothetical protein